MTVSMRKVIRISQVWEAKGLFTLLPDCSKNQRNMAVIFLKNSVYVIP